MTVDKKGSGVTWGLTMTADKKGFGAIGSRSLQLKPSEPVGFTYAERLLLRLLQTYMYNTWNKMYYIYTVPAMEGEGRV